MPFAANDNGRIERRSGQRHRVLLSGKVGWTDKPFTGDCTIRDLSDAGARVRLADPLAPDDPVLIVLRSGQAHSARTAWRRGDMAGLAFQETFDLTQGVPERLKHLRRLWVAHLPH